MMDQRPIGSKAAPTIPALFRERVKRTPSLVAYIQHNPATDSWNEYTWKQMADDASRWQAALKKENLQRGDRVAVMLRNCREWVLIDQAALGLGLVLVPVFFDDRPENVAYILEHSDAKLLVVQDQEQWQRLGNVSEQLPDLQRVVGLANEAKTAAMPLVVPLEDWLAGTEAGALSENESDPKELASIIYTSGTTGRSKGVMLSHWNIIKNAAVAQRAGDARFGDTFLSFLPLSHTLERMGGYILPMVVGATVAYSRSIPQLGEDLVAIKPTILVSVPRIFERVYGKVKAGLEEKSPVARMLFELGVDVGWNRFLYQQGRGSWSPRFLLWPILEKLVGKKVLSKLGGRMRFAVCGGAAMNPEVAQLFIGLGLPIVQGYGLTETSPVITVNRMDDNVPASIGTVVDDVEIRITDIDELETRSECVMLGYWKNEEATQAVMTADGWFRTGDKARIDPKDGHVYITGRLKDIIVLSNGEKVPPGDMEQAISLDPLVEQAMVVGEGKPYLTAVLSLNPETWPAFCDELGVNANDSGTLRDDAVKKKVLGLLDERMSEFPGYAHIKQVTLSIDPWTVDDGLITPTLKVKRPQVMKRFEKEIEEMYAGH